MSVPVPPAFRLHSDVSPAGWIVDGLKPWGKDRVRLWSFLPDVYEAYARVLHPAYRASGEATLRWKELASRNGVTVGPGTGFREVIGVDPEGPNWSGIAPSEGDLSPEQLAELTEVLSACTHTPDRCWLAAWEGWGSWWPGATATLTASRPGGPDDAGIAAAIRSEEEARTRGAEILSSATRIEIPHRAYFLFSCRLADVPSFAIGGWPQAPSIWWPDDRAWCVVTEVDGYSTYVGGPTACIERLVSSGVIEAIEVPADVPMDPGPY